MSTTTILTAAERMAQIQAQRDQLNAERDQLNAEAKAIEREAAKEIVLEGLKALGETVELMTMAMEMGDIDTAIGLYANSSDGHFYGPINKQIKKYIGKLR